MKQKSKIIIVGGGTAGLVSALLIKRRFQNVNIEIVKSQKIGIIGVGEGSTENFTDFVRSCNLNENELINRSDATIKGGILFLNWYKDMYFYNVDKRFTDIRIGQYNGGYSYNYAYDLPHFDTTTRYLAQNLINPNVKVNQYHFNTFKLNEYLIEVCKNRNIKITDDEIVDVSVDDDGISKLKGEKDEYVADFYIDSTGFKRVLMSKLGAKWISYGDQLPLKEAIAFPTGDTDNYAITTLAKAMNSGWRWRIPTNGRHGNGYIYDTDFITKAQAIDEVQTELGHDINVAKNIKFDPGKLDKVWIKNCYAVGLSANFIEPLEATSIGTSINQAFAFMHFLPSYTQKDIDILNKIVDGIMDNVRDFVRLHYINDRRDTPFWRKCAELPMSDSLKHKLSVWKNGKLLRDMDIDSGFTHYTLFKSDNFNMIAAHHGLVNEDKLKQYYESFNMTAKTRTLNKIAFGKYRNSGFYTPFTTHKDYIKQICEKGDHYKVQWPETPLMSFETWKEKYRQSTLDYNNKK